MKIMNTDGKLIRSDNGEEVSLFTLLKGICQSTSDSYNMAYNCLLNFNELKEARARGEEIDFQKYAMFAYCTCSMLIEGDEGGEILVKDLVVKLDSLQKAQQERKDKLIETIEIQRIFADAKTLAQEIIVHKRTPLLEDLDDFEDRMACISVDGLEDVIANYFVAVMGIMFPDASSEEKIGILNMLDSIEDSEASTDL